MVVFLAMINISCASMRPKCIGFPSALLASEFDYVVVEDVEPTTDLNVAKLKFESFLKDGEKRVGGDEMLKRAIAQECNFGLLDLKRLADDSANIPTDLRGKNIVFPGTKVRYVGDRNRPCVAILHWDDERWRIYFHFLDLGFDANDRFACSR